MHAIPSPPPLPLFVSSVAFHIFGIVLLAVVGHAQPGPATNTQAAFSNPLPAMLAAAAEDESIHPFHINIPEEQLADLGRRIAVTKWHERELVGDATQAVPLATMQKFAQYWATDYNWRRVEAKVNAFPQFVTTIDRLDIHFIHVRSKHANAFLLRRAG